MIRPREQRPSLCARDAGRDLAGPSPGTGQKKVLVYWLRMRDCASLVTWFFAHFFSPGWLQPPRLHLPRFYRSFVAATRTPEGTPARAYFIIAYAV